MTATKLTTDPCRFQVNGGYREGELIVKCGILSEKWFVRCSHTGEYFELDESPQLITEPHAET